MKEALKLALEILHYLEALNSDTQRQKMDAIAAIKQALAAPVQEPVESKWSDAGDLKRLKKGDVVRVFRKGQEYYRAFKFYGSIEECDYTYDGNKPFAWLEVGTATLDKIVYTRKDFVTGAVYADRGDVVEILQPVNKETPAAQPAPVQEPVYLVEDDFGLFRITNKGDYTYWSSTGRHKTFIANATPPAQPPQRTEQNFCSRCGKRTPDLITIHTCTPPAAQRTWVGLTEEERNQIWSGYRVSFVSINYIEAKLKEKNA